MPTSFPAARTTLAAALLALVIPGLAAGQQQAVGQSTATNGRDGYQKGSIDWGVVAGGALPVDLSSARPDRRLWMAAIELGRIMTGVHGPGPFAGQFELLVQAMPTVVRGPADFWGVGLSPLFVRWNFAGTRRVRPYAEAAAGLMLIDWETAGPGRVTRNYNEQVGFGVRVGNPSGRGAIVGYRFQHISNGSGSIPSPGIDTHLVFAGFSSVR
jgi:hypothetical protein